MAKDSSFARLGQIIARTLDHPEGGAKNPEIASVLDGLFGVRYQR